MIINIHGEIGLVRVTKTIMAEMIKSKPTAKSFFENDECLSFLLAIFTKMPIAIAATANAATRKLSDVSNSITPQFI
jgi:hypothetical protein